MSVLCSFHPAPSLHAQNPHPTCRSAGPSNRRNESFSGAERMAAMSYFVVCTFDLKNATRTDYENAYADLANLGLRKTVVAVTAETSSRRRQPRWANTP